MLAEKLTKKLTFKYCLQNVRLFNNKTPEQKKQFSVGPLFVFRMWSSRFNDSFNRSDRQSQNWKPPTQCRNVSVFPFERGCQGLLSPSNIFSALLQLVRFFRDHLFAMQRLQKKSTSPLINQGMLSFLTWSIKSLSVA